MLLDSEVHLNHKKSEVSKHATQANSRARAPVPRGSTQSQSRHPSTQCPLYAAQPTAPESGLALERGSALTLSHTKVTVWEKKTWFERNRPGEQAHCHSLAASLPRWPQDTGEPPVDRAGAIRLGKWAGAGSATGQLWEIPSTLLDVSSLVRLRVYPHILQTGPIHVTFWSFQTYLTGDGPLLCNTTASVSTVQLPRCPRPAWRSLHIF